MILDSAIGSLRISHVLISIPTTVLGTDVFARMVTVETVRLNLINHVLTLFRDKFSCNTALRNPVFRWESCKGNVWESVKKCSRLCSEAGTRGWISREARGLQAAKSCTRVKYAGKLNSHASWGTTGKKSRLAIQLARSLNSRLNQVARSSRQPTLFWKKNWLFTFHSHLSINTPHSHKICVAIQKEKP